MKTLTIRAAYPTTISAPLVAAVGQFGHTPPMHEADPVRPPIPVLMLDADPIRSKTADLLMERADVIVADAVAAFPLSAPKRLEMDFCIRLGAAFLRLVADAVRNGGCE